jgi:hypothetical protein
MKEKKQRYRTKTERKRWRQRLKEQGTDVTYIDIVLHEGENDCSRVLGADGMASDLQQNDTFARPKHMVSVATLRR